MRKLVMVLGTPIDDLNMDEALDQLEQFVEIGRATGKTHQIATVNADFVVKAMQDPELRYLLQESDMATADGMPLVWGARMLGVTLEGRVAGADMVPALAGRAAQKGYSIYFLGAAPGVATRAADMLSEANPGLKVAGVCSPPYGSILEMDRQILEDIKATKPDVLLVAFGNPKQEKWIGMYGRELGVPVMIGIGGTLDFITGRTKRAPEWMQKSGLEWIHRLLSEPRRLWKRYAVDMVLFSSFFAKQWLIMRRGERLATVLPKTELLVVDDRAIVNVSGRLTTANIKAFRELGQRALAETNRLVVNLRESEFLDSTAIGSLVGLAKQARDGGGDLVLVAVPKMILETLSVLRLDKFFEVYNNIDQALAKESLAVEMSMQPSKPTNSRASSKWAVVNGPRRLDAGTVAEVKQACVDALAKNPHLILDLSDTVFLASAGLAMLASLHRDAGEKNGELRVTNCSSDVQRVIEMVRFDKVLSLYGDLASAAA
jgi:N-acetylglucosaminyldiphosphoundecaprenol N-acetyl-beta-D-mannosaminyltransferase